ncbi:MAG: hypothetical protein DA394_06450 [Candidatus Arcticimaribacter sp.]|nr:MAG: hypothetical protein DA394_06450 [Candidatus Arcticimaribacter sp.]
MLPIASKSNEANMNFLVWTKDTIFFMMWVKFELRTKSIISVRKYPHRNNCSLVVIVYLLFF